MKVNELASHIVQWDSLVKSWGGRYMFILAPCKLDRALEMLPPGCDPKKQNRYESIDRLHDLLSKKGVQMLDLSYDLAGNLEAVSRNFYHTDHHWRYEAAFEKFPEIARKIAALAGHELPEDLPQFNIEQTKFAVDGRAYLEFVLALANHHNVSAHILKVVFHLVHLNAAVYTVLLQSLAYERVLLGRKLIVFLRLQIILFADEILFTCCTNIYHNHPIFHS